MTMMIAGKVFEGRKLAALLVADFLVDMSAGVVIGALFF